MRPLRTTPQESPTCKDPFPRPSPSLVESWRLPVRKSQTGAVFCFSIPFPVPYFSPSLRRLWWGGTRQLQVPMGCLQPLGHRQQLLPYLTLLQEHLHYLHLCSRYHWWLKLKLFYFSARKRNYGSCASYPMFCFSHIPGLSTCSHITMIQFLMWSSKVKPKVPPAL